MVGKGVVIKTDGITATVKVHKSSACGHDCGECRLCSNPEIEVEILNPIGAKVGDTVTIGTDTAKVLKDAFMLYMLPIIGAMVVYALSGVLLDNIALKVISVAMWIAVWFMYMRFYSKRRVTMSSAQEVVNEKN